MMASICVRDSTKTILSVKKRMTIEELLESRKNDPRWNTSYPLTPSDWVDYRVQGSLSFKNDARMSFYIHIPFCKQLCSFCEYTRMICPDEEAQRAYLLAVSHDIKQFKQCYTDFTLLGFDIGGGTPTALSEDNFSLLMKIYQDSLAGLNLSDDYEPSIEGTFNTLSERKLEEMSKSGFHRLSLGVQSSCGSVLRQHHRGQASEDMMSSWLTKAWGMGIRKVNLDFMYGLQGQNEDTIGQDLELIKYLAPQQVTLYELRTNMISNKFVCSKIELFEQYSQFYDGLTAMGYQGRIGQNTFSLYPDDHGVSSYLRERMLNGSSYKGFGLSAQSMSKVGLSYNLGKSQVPSKFVVDKQECYPEEYTYLLPQQELASKYLAISAYHGSFSLPRLMDFGISREVIQRALDFCISEGLMKEGDDNRMYVTHKGFKYYGALFSLFYAPYYEM